MPTYDYRCNACGHAFELFQSMTAKHEKKCPKCGKNALERLIGTGAAVLFKGSGFYQTDYRSEGYKKAADADKPAAAAEKSDSKASDATKPATETKAEAKPDTAKPAESSKSDSKQDSKPASPTSGAKSSASSGAVKIHSKPTKPSKASSKSSKKSK